jgi:hypothetical protein
VAAKCIQDLMAMGKESVPLVLISHHLWEIGGETGQPSTLYPKSTLAAVHGYLTCRIMKSVMRLTLSPPLGLLDLITLGPLIYKALFEVMAFGIWREQRYQGYKKNKKKGGPTWTTLVMTTQICRSHKNPAFGCKGRGNSWRRKSSLFGDMRLGSFVGCHEWTHGSTFCLQMGESSSKMPERSSLACLLKYWGDLHPQSLKKQAIAFYCIETWPKYHLGDNETWFEGITLTTILFYN